MILFIFSLKLIDKVYKVCNVRMRPFHVMHYEKSGTEPVEAPHGNAGLREGGGGEAGSGPAPAPHAAPWAWNWGTDNPPANKNQFRVFLEESCHITGKIVISRGDLNKYLSNPACLPREVKCVEEAACVETVDPDLSTVRHQQQVVQRAEVESVAPQSWPGLHWATFINTSYI